MMLDQLAGNHAVVSALQAALAGGTLPHAVLLTAPDGCGRNAAARRLAADWLYPAGGAAAEAVLRGESAEVLAVAGEGKSGMIPVDRIRALRSDVHLSSLGGAGRVVLVRDAHQMAAPAANALLKVLEEPPSEVLFILTARDAALLPPTITSRCALYPLAALEVHTCRALLEKALPAGADAKLPQLLAVLYGGRAGLGLRVLENAERLVLLQDALAAAGAAARQDAYALGAVFARYEGRAEDAREKRDALLGDVAGVLEAALLGHTAPGLPPMPPAVAALLLGPVAEARKALRGNAAPKVTFAALVVHLVQAGKAE
ncbi:MAG: hypothetical protein AB7V55_04260 [Oscillospiraceae bacterium]